MLNVVIFELGFAGQVNLDKVCRIVNRAQREIRLQRGDRMENIGEPDIGDVAYSRDRLFARFDAYRSADLLVGVLQAPMEDNFYTHTQGEGWVALSLYQTKDICVESARSAEEYVAHTVVTELLWLQYRKRVPGAHYLDLFHMDTCGCIFDFVLMKMDKVHKLRAPCIDVRCRNKLREANVPERLTDAVESVLNAINMPSMRKSFMVSLHRPGFSFVLGGVIGGMCVNLLTDVIAGGAGSRTFYALLFMALLAVVVIVANWVTDRGAVKSG